MSLFLPANVDPLPKAASLQDWSDGAYSDADYFKIPSKSKCSVSVKYSQL